MLCKAARRALCGVAHDTRLSGKKFGGIHMQKPHQLMHELTGLFLDKNTGVYFGTYGGFSVFILSLIHI